jgi:hypothetical protein
VVSKDWQLPRNGQGTRQYPVTERESGQRLRMFGFRVRGVKRIRFVLVALRFFTVIACMSYAAARAGSVCWRQGEQKCLDRTLFVMHLRRLALRVGRSERELIRSRCRTQMPQRLRLGGHHVAF